MMTNPAMSPAELAAQEERIAQETWEAADLDYTISQWVRQREIVPASFFELFYGLRAEGADVITAVLGAMAGGANYQPSI